MNKEYGPGMLTFVAFVCYMLVAGWWLMLLVEANTFITITLAFCCLVYWIGDQEASK